MEIPEMLDRILKGSQYLGTFSFPDILSLSAVRQLNAIAVAKKGNQEYYLAIVKGEPEGAIFLDPDGALFGDNAVVRFRTDMEYTLNEVKPDIIDALVMGCRIFEKGHIQKSLSCGLFEIGEKSEGVGIVTVQVRKEKIPCNGIRVSLRKNGKILGSDVTTANGEVSFRVMHGTYTCIVYDSSHSVMHFRITFDESHSFHIIDI